jgi:hypothetical protein
MPEGCPPLDNMLKGCENPGGGAVLGVKLGTESDQPKKPNVLIHKFLIIRAELPNELIECW